ncbi:MAG: ankyrin repeat domain-containing protein [Puniceicoccales bacterium]|jgi:ankyrin repeat protein|nr:ankyrin repeat domain-containing protein [Puniceicoccales bacterium]
MVKSVILGGLLLLGVGLLGIKVQATADEVASDVLSKDLDLSPNDGAKITTKRDPRGPNSELYWAIFHRDSTRLRELLDKKVVDVNAVFPNGEHYPNGNGTETTTLLQQAVYRGNVEMVKLLVEYGADPNQRRLDRFGLAVSPLSTAVRFAAHPDIVKFLIENGADPHQRYDDNNTLLLEAMADPRPSKKWVEVARLLLDQGLDPN